MGEAYTPLSYEDNLQRFMSPYQQNVTDIEKREARRQSEISGKRHTRCSYNDWWFRWLS